MNKKGRIRSRYTYNEGDVFFVPAGDLGWMRGIATRLDDHWGVFGYFFLPLFSDPEIGKIEPFKDITLANAVWACKFGGGRLQEAKWPNLGQLPDWNRDEWPMPNFRAYGDIVTLYGNELTPIGSVNLKDYKGDPAKLLPDGVCGPGAVEICLRKVIEGTEPRISMGCNV